MKNTFDDRLLGAVMDEVRDPSVDWTSVAAFDADPGDRADVGDHVGDQQVVALAGARRSRDMRRRRVGLAVAGIAAAGISVALIAGLINDPAGSTKTRVGSTAASGSSAANADGGPYLTFATPVGTLRRNSIGSVPSATTTFQPTDGSGWRFEVGKGLTDSTMFDHLEVVGSSNGREVRTLAAADSGGQAFGTYFWKEADGSSWSVSPWRNSNEPPPAEEERRALVLRFLDALTVDGSHFAPGAGFEAYQPIDRAARRWSILDDHLYLESIDTETDLSTLGGEPVSVRGTEGVFANGILYWRVAPDTVFALSMSFLATSKQAALDDADARARAEHVPPTSAPSPLESAVLDQRDLPIEQRSQPQASTQLTVQEARTAADALVASSAGAYHSLAPWRGAEVERLVVLPPKGADSSVDTLSIVAAWNDPSAHAEVPGDGLTTAAYGGVWPDGWAFGPPSSVTTVKVWAHPADQPYSTLRPPACAQTVNLPPVGQPPVTVVLDPTCTD